MARTAQDVTEAELAILQVFWDTQGPVTVRQLTDELYPRGTAAQYATVQKLLERLEAKECVTRDRGHWPHRFDALLSRDELIDRRLRAVAEKLCGGSLVPLLTHLLQTKRFSAHERQELRALVAQLDEKARPKEKKV